MHLWQRSVFVILPRLREMIVFRLLRGINILQLGQILDAWQFSVIEHFRLSY